MSREVPNTSVHARRRGYTGGDCRGYGDHLQGVRAAVALPQTTLLNVVWHNLTLANETTFTSAAAPQMLEAVAARFVLEHFEQAVATPVL
jgi:hypothetical protein